MFNLLPNIFKDEIRSEYKLRKIVVLLSFVLVVLISVLVLSFSLWIISLEKEKEINLQIEKENQTQSSQNANDILKLIDQTNKKLLVFDKVMEYPEILPIYSEIIIKKINGIVLRDFSYSLGSNDTLVTVKGVANTRETLVSFVKNLEQAKIFNKVELPVSNLAKQKNIDFTVSIKINN